MIKKKYTTEKILSYGCHAINQRAKNRILPWGSLSQGEAHKVKYCDGMTLFLLNRVVFQEKMCIFAAH